MSFNPERLPLGDSASETTPDELTAKYLSLVEELGINETQMSRNRCPTPEHVAGHYIVAYGGIDRAINGINIAMSGQYVDQVPNAGDDQVLEILLKAKQAKPQS